jgi:hypothetical protein
MPYWYRPRTSPVRTVADYKASRLSFQFNPGIIDIEDSNHLRKWYIYVFEVKQRKVEQAPTLRSKMFNMI